MKKYFVIYKTTNTVNQKYCIGKHETYNLNDRYLGSGVALSAAIKKYGKENFVKEVLYVFTTKDQMDAKEKELVNESMLADPKCYNVALGGHGGNLGPEVNKKIGLTMAKVLKNVKKSESHIEAIRLSKQSYRPTDSTIKQIRETSNSNYANMSKEEKRKKYGHKGAANGCAKPLTFKGVFYTTRKECCEALNITKRQLYKLLGEK